MPNCKKFRLPRVSSRFCHTIVSRSLFCFLSLFLLGSVITARTVEAKPKFWSYGWSYEHWINQDFKPYLMPPGEPHNRQWDYRLEERGPGRYEQWTPADWMGEDKGLSTLRGFFENGVLVETTVKRDVPVLIVGETFFDLSGYDKRRVTDFVNHVYNLTDSDPAYFRLRDARTREWIGYYDQFGLRLR